MTVFPVKRKPNDTTSESLAVVSQKLIVNLAKLNKDLKHNKTGEKMHKITISKANHSRFLSRLYQGFPGLEGSDIFRVLR